MERKVTATEFKTRTGRYIDQAGKGPLFITKHNRTARVLLDVEEYRRLKRLDDRMALHAQDLTDDELLEVARGDMPAGYDHLDAELND